LQASQKVSKGSVTISRSTKLLPGSGVQLRMRRNPFDTPLGLIFLTGVGCVVSSLSFYAMDRHWGSRSIDTIVLQFAVLMAGIALLFWAPSQLREGVLNEQWPAAMVDPLRRVAQHPACRALIGFLFVAMLVALGIDVHHSLYFWEIFYVQQAIMHLSNAFAPPRRKPGPRTTLDWTKVPPLHSEHWGER